MKKQLMKHGLGKRICSIIMAFAMVFSLMQILPNSLITAEAGDGTVKLYFELPDGTSEEDWAVNAWGTNVSVTGNGEAAFRPSTWGDGDTFPTLLTDNNLSGWGYVTISGTIDGLQFVNMAGTEYKCWNAQITAQGYETAYFAPDTGLWYAESTKTTEIKEAEVRNIFILAGASGLAGSNWDNKDSANALVQDADDTNKFSITFTNIAAGTYEYKILQDPENKGWDLPWGNGDNRSITVEALSDVTFTIDLTDSDKNVTVAQTPVDDDNEDDTDDKDVSSLTVSDSVQLKIGDTVTNMLVYMNGVYEVPVELSSGTYAPTVLVNGEEHCVGNEVTVSADTTVYFRLKDGELLDSVNNKIVHTAAFTGNFNGLEFVDESSARYDISSWNPADANAELDYIGGGLYSRTFTFNELAADLELADTGYKVAFDDGWDYSIGNGSSNIGLTIPAGSTSLTVFTDEVNGVVYDSVRTGAFESVHNDGNIERAPFTTAISLIGSARGGNSDWEPAATGWEFTPISETLYRYQKTFNSGSYSYKCVFDYTNWYEAEGDQSFTAEEDGTTVIFLYDTETGFLYDSVNDASEVAIKLGMEAEPAKMEVKQTSNGSIDFIALADADKNVKLVYGNKEEVKDKGADALTSVAMSESEDGVYVLDEVLWLGDDAAEIVYYYDVDGTRTLDGSNPTETVNGANYSVYSKEEFTGRTVNVPGTFPGPSWDAASNEMTYLGDGLYQYTFKNVPAANYEFKIAFGSWTENYGVGGIQDGANIAVTVPETQDVKVYYNDFSHLAVTDIDYVFADISLTGTGIPTGTKLTDNGLTGIYSATISMTAGIYSDVVISYDGKEYEFAEFTVDSDKDVTFYFDPVTGIFYNNASNDPVDTDKIYYTTKDTEYKSIYGAVPTETDVTFTIATGADVETASMVIKGVERKTLTMAKKGDVVDGIQKWSVTTSFNTIGENDYYFVVSNGSAVSVYADDDGYYGEGTTTDLTDILPYELVVYEKGYETPDWMKNAVIYQIFPDRFFNGDTSNDFAQTSARGEVDYEFITDWYTIPENPEQEGLLTQEEYEATGAYYGDGQWSNEMYGGDFAGIVERIDYLKALGVNVIYLNPVFASISSHRYDTSDYSMMDPILGDLGDFTKLVEVAEANDMHIILDGVFNHVSDDSIYFDRYYKYLEAGTDTIGAYPYWAYVYDYMAENDVDEETAEKAAKSYFTEKYGITDYSYTGWFDVYDTPMSDGNGGTVSDNIGLRAGEPVYGYEGWWGYDSMPVIMSTNGSEYQTGTWAEEIIYNEDETSVTQYWITQGNNGWRLDVANEVSDETWQKFRESVKALDSDAVIVGEIWDDATEYLLGDMYDSVMNYVFRGAVLGYAKGGTSTDAMNTLEKIRERYPEEAFYAMMNLVDSHDTTRVLSFLDGIDDDRNQKDINSAFPTYETTSDLAKARQYLVAFLQFTYAGAPTIYYGDEIGMVGADDPDDRRGFTWGEGNKELVTWYATLAAIRESYPALRTGSLEVFNENDAVMSYVRRDNDDTLIVLSNNGQDELEITLDLDKLNVSADELTDLISSKEYSVSGNTVKVTVPALSGAILTANAKTITVDQDALAPAYDESYKVAESVLAEAITIDKTTASLKTGESLTLTAKVTPDDATDKSVIWLSSDESVATVDANGKVTAISAGTVVITAKAAFSPENLVATCTITVTKSVENNTPEPSELDKIIQKIEDTKEGNTITVTLKNEDGSVSTVVPKRLLQSIKESGVDVIVDMGDYSWKIYADKIGNKDLKDVNLEVIVDTKNIPSDKIDKLAGDKPYRQLSIKYDGEFGFTADLTIKLDKKYSGKYGNLYYYNKNNKLECVDSDKIREDGSVTYTFTHASDYVIVIDNESAKVSAGADTGDVAFPIVPVVILVAGAGLALITLKKKYTVK